MMDDVLAAGAFMLCVALMGVLGYVIGVRCSEHCTPSREHVERRVAYGFVRDMSLLAGSYAAGCTRASLVASIGQIDRHDAADLCRRAGVRPDDMPIPERSPLESPACGGRLPMLKIFEPGFLCQRDVENEQTAVGQGGGGAGGSSEGGT